MVATRRDCHRGNAVFTAVLHQANMKITTGMERNCVLRWLEHRFRFAIAFQGMTSRVIKKEGSSWYRVVLGPYKFKRDAEKDRHKLQRAKIEPCAIWKENL